MNERPSAEVRIRAMKRDRFQCTYCGAPGTDVELEIDHIIPVAKGGSHHISNLTTACLACNRSKGANDAPARTHAPSRPAAGFYVHMYEALEIRYQGRIVGEDGDRFLVQMFSWWTGNPTTVEIFEKAFIYSDKCKLYGTHDAWLAAADAEAEVKYGGKKAFRVQVVRVD